MYKNIVLGSITLDPAQLHYVRRHEHELRRLVRKGMLDAERVGILQKGGFLMRILALKIARKAGPTTDHLAHRLISKI